MIIFDLSIAIRADVLYDFIKPGIPSFFPPKYLTTIIKVFVKSLVSIAFKMGHPAVEFGSPSSFDFLHDLSANST